MRFHRIADIFPLMEGGEFDSLVQDIREHGLLESVWTFEDKIIDGRNRWRACAKAGVKPTLRQWHGKGSPLDFIVSMNLKRRQLDESQRGMVAAKLANLKHGQKKADRPVGLSQPDAAKKLDVGTMTVKRAKQVYKHGDKKIIAAVESGKMTLTKAAHSIKRGKIAKGQTGKFATGYRVLYVDPPWSYGSDLVDGYGAVKHHYPSMSITELCNLTDKTGKHVSRIGAANSVLFLWATSPMLEVAFEVIRAWKYKYKTSFVWDKVAHNYGHYNSVRHELLLICTRGSCLPDSKVLVDSVQSIKRTKKHSEKPAEFRAIIDQMYRKRKGRIDRIELFARSKVAGWDSFGNECAN